MQWEHTWHTTRTNMWVREWASTVFRKRTYMTDNAVGTHVTHHTYEHAGAWVTVHVQWLCAWDVGNHDWCSRRRNNWCSMAKSFVLQLSFGNKLDGRSKVKILNWFNYRNYRIQCSVSPKPALQRTQRKFDLTQESRNKKKYRNRINFFSNYHFTRTKCQTHYKGFLHQVKGV